ncbi:MAG: alkaline shock response membrane anchor protein AmaP [Tumebacillaceae bacterium]
MKIVPRMLLWIYAFAVLLVSGFVLVVYANNTFVGGYKTIRIDDTSAAIALLMLLVSIFFLFYRTKRSERHMQAVTHKMENGDVKITFETIEKLAGRAAAKIRGVQDLKTRVRVQENGALVIGVRFAVEADTDIPKTTAELQETVKQYIEGTTGVPVEQVAVYVTELAAPVVKETVKKRVE